MSAADLAAYLERPMDPPPADVLRSISAGPIDPADALTFADVERLLDPDALAVEDGWCTLPDGVGYVAVRCGMPAVTGEMVDWWFDWHPRDPVRYRIWHPLAHHDNSLEPPARAQAKPYWGATHHPVEDIGTGVVHARIEFRPPTEMGFSGEHLDDPHVAAIVCGLAGDERLRVRHTRMVHAFVRDGDGVFLRSRFWIGEALRPFGALGGVGELLMNNAFVRRRAIPAAVPRALARHCAEEYTNLGALLPELYARFGPGA